MNDNELLQELLEEVDKTLEQKFLREVEKMKTTGFDNLRSYYDGKCHGIAIAQDIATGIIAEYKLKGLKR